jgi:hypothetical protein
VFGESKISRRGLRVGLTSEERDLRTRFLATRSTSFPAPPPLRILPADTMVCIECYLPFVAMLLHFLFPYFARAVKYLTGVELAAPARATCPLPAAAAAAARPKTAPTAAASASAAAQAPASAKAAAPQPEPLAAAAPAAPAAAEAAADEAAGASAGDDPASVE